MTSTARSSSSLLSYVVGLGASTITTHAYPRLAGNDAASSLAGADLRSPRPDPSLPVVWGMKMRAQLADRGPGRRLGWCPGIGSCGERSRGQAGGSTG